MNCNYYEEKKNYNVREIDREREIVIFFLQLIFCYGIECVSNIGSSHSKSNNRTSEVIAFCVLIKP